MWSQAPLLIRPYLATMTKYCIWELFLKKIASLSYALPHVFQIVPLSYIFCLVCIQNFPPHVWDQCGDDRRFCNCGWHCPWCLHWVEEIIFKSQCHIVTMSQCHNVIMTQCRNVTLYLGLTLGKIDYIQLTMSYWEKGSMRWPHNFSFGIDANHLITCSFMAAPCSLAVSKLFYPETEQTKTAIEV